VRIADGVLAEHWDVLQDEGGSRGSKSGLPMFRDSFTGLNLSGVTEGCMQRGIDIFEGLLNLPPVGNIRVISLRCGIWSLSGA